MIKLWKMITGSLHEKNFEAKTTNTISAEGKEDGTDSGRRNAETGYDDTPSRRRSADSCYVSYYDDLDGDDSYRATTSCTGYSYSATGSDFYIGVASEAASTIYLPTAVRDGKIIVIKAEMKPPIGRRKITVATLDGSLIDGYSELVLQVSHEHRTVIFRDGHWHIIGK